MKRRLLSIGSAVLAFALAEAAGVGTARAEEPTADDIASARVLGSAGIAAAEHGDCATAVPKLAGAEKLFHAPSTASWLGRCQIKLGQLVAGTEILVRVTREKLPPGAPAVFREAQREAEKSLALALPRIAKLRVQIHGPAVSAVKMTVDSTDVLPLVLAEGRPTDPGTHEVMATADGFLPVTVNVALGEGETKEVAVTLQPAPKPVVVSVTNPSPASGSETSVTPPPPPPPAAEPAPSRAPTFIAFGVGAVGLVTGAASGILALQAHNTLNGDCGPAKTSCSESDRSKITEQNTEAWVANVGFGVAIVGAAVGTVLLLTSGHRAEHPQVKASASALHVTPFVTTNSVGLFGAF
jgi:hypothetical protein